MSQSEQINELAAALAKVQMEIKDAKIDGRNPHFKSEYSTLESVLGSIRPVAGKHGLSVTQTAQPLGDNMAMVTTLMHVSGQWVQSVMPMQVDMSKPQVVGSFITYYRRYSLAAMFGITDTDKDDDANEAQADSIIRISESEVEELKALIGTQEPFKTNAWNMIKTPGYKRLEDIEKVKLAGIKKSIINLKNS